MSTINFKSVGRTKLQKATETTTTSTIPVGLKTPLSLGDKYGVFEMHDNLLDQISDNLRNLIQTNWGGRLGLYNYGANLYPLVTEFSTQDDFDAAATERISSAVALWMPYVSLDEYVSSIDRIENKNTAIVKLKITYSVPAINKDKRSLEVTLYVI